MRGNGMALRHWILMIPGWAKVRYLMLRSMASTCASSILAIGTALIGFIGISRRRAV
jgi:hypothetical protein